MDCKLPFVLYCFILRWLSSWLKPAAAKASLGYSIFSFRVSWLARNDSWAGWTMTGYSWHSHFICTSSAINFFSCGNKSQFVKGGKSVSWIMLTLKTLVMGEEAEMGWICIASQTTNHSKARWTCPACPQISINLSPNWKVDLNQWVFHWVLTVDGNFKANYVWQKSAADDIWLLDGLGMTTTNSEYKNFLQTAQERKTVSVNKGWLISISSFG